MRFVMDKTALGQVSPSNFWSAPANYHSASAPYSSIIVPRCVWEAQSAYHNLSPYMGLYLSGLRI